MNIDFEIDHRYYVSLKCFNTSIADKYYHLLKKLYTEHRFSQEFVDWCRKNQYDPYKKENGCGEYPIGTFTKDDSLVFTSKSKYTGIQFF